MIVDFHTHVFPPRVRERRDEYAARDAIFAEVYSAPRSQIASADELIANMDEDGVNVSVILNGGWATHELCVEVNDYVLESVARHPDRLVGFCTVQPGAGAAAVREVERCARGGARGIGEMRPDSLEVGAESDEMAAVLEVARRHRLVLLVHASEPVGHEYRGKGAATPEVVYSWVRAAQGVSVVCAHWGGGLPFYALMPEVGEGLGNAYFDSAASPFLYHPRVYREVVGLVGAGKVLFGSDYPLLRPRRLLRQIDSLDLEDGTRTAILSGNACRLLGLHAESGAA
jgi:predicted TIM-barrel fold metal-dependent hydrolase